MLPFTDSAVVGLNFTVTAKFCAGDSVTGNVTPLTVTSFAFTLICEIVTVLLPLFDIVTLVVADFPALTFPKFTLVGFATTVTVAATPVPLNEIAVGELGALLARLKLPLKFPAVCGANCTLNELLCPTASVSGVASPLTLNPAPVMVACAMVKLAVPVFLTVTCCGFELPFTTLPKLIAVGNTLRAA
jgi:hypothetical protein